MRNRSQRVGSRPQASEQRRILAAILTVTLASCLAAAHWGLPDGTTPESSSPWGVDTIAPLGPLNEAYYGFTRAGVEDVIYPLFQYVVLAGVYAPYVVVAWLTGALRDPSSEFPYGATDPSSFFVHLTLLAALTTALMAVGVVLLVHLLARELFDDRPAALWAAGLAALVPPVTYYGMSSNLDVPYLFWTLLALWLLLRGARRGHARSFVLCGIAAGFAVATKDQAAGFFVLLPVLVPGIVASWRRREGHGVMPWQVLMDRRVLASGVAALGSFALANNLLFGGLDGYLRHLQFLEELYAANIAPGGTRELLARQPGLLAHNARLIIEMVGVPVLILVVLGAWLCVRRGIWSAMLLPAVVLGYYVTVLGPTLALSRYLLGPVLLCLPFAGLAIATLLKSSRRAVRSGVAILTAATLLWQSALLAHLHWTLWTDSRYAMERWIRTNVPPGAEIESSTQPRYLPRISDQYRYVTVGNAFSSISYGLLGDELTLERLEQRNPQYILVLADSGLTGDPLRLTEPDLLHYYDELLSGAADYNVVAKFETPTWLPYRQITAGTQPTTILLERRQHNGAASP